MGFTGAFTPGTCSKTLNKGTEPERETEGTIEPFVSLCAHAPRPHFYRRWLRGEDMFLHNETQCKINK